MSAPGRSQALMPQPFKGEGGNVSAPGRSQALMPQPIKGEGRNVSAPGRSQALMPQPFKGEGRNVSAPGRSQALMPKPCRGAGRPMSSRSTGFTLVELLVTLVITALVTTLLWEALGQTARLEQRLASDRLAGDRDMLRRAWIEDALAGAMTGPIGDPRAFAGDASSMATYTTRPPSTLVQGPAWTVLRLQRGGERTELRVEGQEHALWQWSGDGRFEYLDRDGSWHERWPPQKDSRAALPRAVRLVGPPGGDLVAAILADQSPMLRLADVLADELARP